MFPKTRPTPSRRVPSLSCIGSALLWTLMLAMAHVSVTAAPSEGTAGQTVTSRSLHHNPARHASNTPVVATAPSTSKPAWKDLMPAQQEALRPLAPHWDRLSQQRKLKWLLISKNYDTMPSAEQAKLHQRMSQWVTLSRQERLQARQNYKEIQGLSAEQKASQWEAYQALNSEEKRKLATQGRTKPSGLTTTVKPNTSARLTPVPPRRQPGSTARLAEAGSPVQQNTLLPRVEPARSAPERSPYEDEPSEAQ